MLDEPSTPEQPVPTVRDVGVPDPARGDVGVDGVADVDTPVAREHPARDGRQRRDHATKPIDHVRPSGEVGGMLVSTLGGDLRRRHGAVSAVVAGGRLGRRSGGDRLGVVIVHGRPGSTRVFGGGRRIRAGAGVGLGIPCGDVVGLGSSRSDIVGPAISCGNGRRPASVRAAGLVLGVAPVTVLVQCRHRVPCGGVTRSTGRGRRCPAPAFDTPVRRVGRPRHRLRELVGHP